MAADKLTIAQEFQKVLYDLLQKKVMSLEGPVLTINNQLPTQFISRDEMVDQLICVMNEFGEAMNSDERLNKCD